MLHQPTVLLKETAGTPAASVWSRRCAPSSTSRRMGSSGPGTLRLATRGSPLALRQTELVSELLARPTPASPSNRSSCARRATAATAPLDQMAGRGCS